MAGLLLDTSLDDRQRAYAEAVRASTDDLLVVVNGILDFSELNAGGVALESMDFSLAAVIEDVADLFTGQARAKGLALAIELADDLPAEGRGCPGQLRQVLVNLVSNAVKFTSTGNIVISAGVISSTEESTTVQLQVRDTGIGVDARSVARVFEPFFQADSSSTRRYGGTGLGLAITRQLVQLMGGRCGLDSQPGRGTAVWFTVPLFRAREDAGSSSSLTKSEAAMEPGEVDSGTETSLRRSPDFATGAGASSRG